MPQTACKVGHASNNPCSLAAGQLCIIAFYFLLRVGEYTPPRMKNGKRATRTIQFAVQDVGFWKDEKPLDRNSPLEVLITADAATLRITNQKNGKKGQQIHREALKTQNITCPVVALAQRVHHILNNGGNESSLLCDFFVNGKQHHVTSYIMRKTIKATVTALNLKEQGITANDVGTHSFRAGGAMALKLAGCDDTTIMTMGRWSGMTFLEYIHTQIGHLSAGITDKMSQHVPFLNVAGF